MTPNDDGTYQLVLNGVDAEVIAFTDRPDRDTASLSLDQLVNSWDDTFADSAPNGVLVARKLGAKPDSLVIELFNPLIDGTTMTYTVRVLADENAGTRVVDDPTVSAPPVPPATFLAASLFIDSVGLRYACLKEPGDIELYPPGDVPSGGVTKVYRDQCLAAGGSIGETFG